MNKKNLSILILVILVAVAAGVYFYVQHNPPAVKINGQADEERVRSAVESFGGALKNVSLLSETASEDIETNYKDLIDSTLLSQWKEDPSKAVGRVTSSPWPDRIEIVSIAQMGSGAYDVSGNIVEITSVEGAELRLPVKLGLVKFDDKWLITGVAVEESTDANSIASQLKDCMPKSDIASKEKCEQLLESIRNFDQCVAAGFDILKSNPPQCQVPGGEAFTQETNSTWGMAVEAVNNCEVNEVFQTHREIVTLTLKNGNKLIATEPEIDDIFDIAKAVEYKCGKIIVATE